MVTILASIPQPPVDAVMPKMAETIFNVFIFIPLGIALALAVRKLLKGQGPLLLYCIIGGALAASFEPVVDVLGLVYLKEQGALGTFTILDRTMPLYICFVYPWYVGGLGYLAYKLFKRGVTMRDLFQDFVAAFIADPDDPDIARAGGLRAGRYRLDGRGTLTLRRLSFVPGVRLSGRIENLGLRRGHGVDECCEPLIHQQQQGGFTVHATIPKLR